MLQEYERRMLSYGVPAPPPVPPPPAAAPPQQLYGGHGLVGADLGAQHGGHGVKQVSSCRQQSQPKIPRFPPLHSYFIFSYQTAVKCRAHSCLEILLNGQ